VDFVRNHVDIALRRNDFHWGKQCHAEPVATEMVGPVCTPAVWKKVINGIPVRLLHARTRADAWNQWGRLSDQKIASNGAEHYEHFYLSLQAAGSGMGVAIASAFMVESDLQDGRLVAPFGFIAGWLRICRFVTVARPSRCTANSVVGLAPGHYGAWVWISVARNGRVNPLNEIIPMPTANLRCVFVRLLWGKQFR
jgi:DNA-binding transcriptional LysR family regulator